MTDPSTLFLSTPQIRPSWTINGLTLELNLAPTHGNAVAASESNNYATQTFQGIHPNNAATGAVFASVVGQGQCASTPLRFAVRGGSSCWTQTAPSEPVTNNMPAVVGDSIFAITQSAAFLSAGLGTNTNGHQLNAGAPATATAGSVPVSNAAGATTFVPSNAVFEQGLCQLQQLMAKGLLNGSTPLSSATPTTSNAVSPLNSCTGNGYLVATTATTDGKKKSSESAGRIMQRQSTPNLERKKCQKIWKSGMVVAPQGTAETAASNNSTATTASSVHELSPLNMSSAVNTSRREGTPTSAHSISVAVSEHSLSSPTTTIMSPSDQKLGDRTFHSVAMKKDANGTPCQVAEITTSTLSNRNDHSSLSSDMRTSTCDIIPSQSEKLTALVTSSLSSHLPTSTQSATMATIPAPSLVSSAVTASSATVMNNGGIPVGIAIARQRYVSNSNHKTQTHSVKDTISTSSSTTSYASAMPYHQTVIDNTSVFPSPMPNIGVVTGANGCDDRNGANIGGGILPPIIAWPAHPSSLPSQQPQHNTPQWHPCTGPVEPSVQNMPSTCAGYNPISGQIVLIPANQIGVMMPCDLAKPSAVNPTNASAAIGQQLISTNNSSFSLVQQFNSSNIHNSSINVPHHFSSISSSGSVLIQQISGNTGPPPLINHVNNSLMIAETAATQSVISSQPPYPTTNASYLINTQHLSSENSGMDQVPASPCIITTSDNFNPFSSSSESVIYSKPSTVQLNLSAVKPTDSGIKTVSNEVCSAQSNIRSFTADRSREEAMITVDTNSSVQDASNQTESIMSSQEDDDDHDDDNDNEDEEDDGHNLRVTESYENEESDPLKKDKESKTKCKSVGNERKVYSDQNPDFSGLQLLLNGIERAEHCSNNDSLLEIENTASVRDEKLKIKQESEDSDKEMDNPAPNGLQILCALADQRFQEENDGESDDSSSSDSFVRKRMLYKTSKSIHPHKYEVGHQYKSAESEQETRRILSSKYSSHRIRSLSPCGSNQLQMRIELAKLRKQYCDAQKELKRLSHRKYARSTSPTRSPTPSLEPQSVSYIESDSGKSGTPAKRRPGRPRKYSDNLDSTKANSDIHLLSPIKPMKRPKLKLDSKSFLQGSEDEEKVSKSNIGDLSPPVLEPMCTPPKPKSFKSDILSPPTLIPSKKSYFGPKGLHEIEHKRPSEFENKPLFRLSSDDSSDDDTFDPKFKLELPGHRDTKETGSQVPKRKVGRPRKYPKEDVSLPTEAMTKKSKTSVKASSSGLAVANKKKEKRRYSPFNKSSEKQVPVTSSVVSTFAMLKSQRKSTETNQDTVVECKPKITPKLKAEAKLKTWRQESPESCSDTLDVEYNTKKRKAESMDDFLNIKERKDVFNKRSKCHAKSKDYAFSSSLSNAVRIPSSTSSEYSNEDFRITPELLDSCEKCPVRVLIAVGGLFRAGELSAVRPPDLYGIKLDGERGQRTHIYTKEEILKDVVLEVRGKYPLRNGTRVCAFWSSQYLSLYPGFVSSFSSSDESEDENFTAVEFDDGDSGRINMSDIRLLPKDFSINHRIDDFSSSDCTTKRKRRISSMSYEEIPIDKQLHSPESPTLCRQFSGKSDQNAHSPLTTSTAYDSSSRSSSNNERQSDRKPKASATVEEPPLEHDNADKEKSGERRRLKKKRKDKFRESGDPSWKRKSHKHKSDTDEGSAKARKRHKHKHKHHKHHKRRRSPSGRKYAVEEEAADLCGCSNSGAKTIEMSEDSEWTHVPPYSEHLNKVKKSNVLVADKSEVEESARPSSCKSKDRNREESSRNEKQDSEVKEVKCRPLDPGERKSVGRSKLVPEVIKKDITSCQTDANEVEEPDVPVIPEVEVDDEPVLSAEESASVEKKVEDAVKPKPEKMEASKKVSKTKSSIERDLTPVSTETAIKPSTSKMTEEEEEESSSSDCAVNAGDKFWDWCGKGFKRNGKGRARKEFYKSIKRGDVIINVGDCAVFLTAGSSAKPFIGRIESMWESYGNMMVRVNWFYHPEETTGLTQDLPFLGALFESPHNDKNDVQTISHKCDVVTVDEYRKRLLKEPERKHNVYQSNDLYYLAGFYDPTTKRLTFEDGILS